MKKTNPLRRERQYSRAFFARNLKSCKADADKENAAGTTKHNHCHGETTSMKFILSFLIVSTILSADTCYKLGVANAALTPNTLCAPVNSLTPVTPIKCEPVIQPIQIKSTIKCDLPTPAPTPTPIVSKCTPLPVECPKKPSPIVDNGKCTDPNTPVTPQVPKTSAVPEPASYALLGAGLITAGIARRYGKKSE